MIAAFVQWQCYVALKLPLQHTTRQVDGVLKNHNRGGSKCHGF